MMNYKNYNMVGIKSINQRCIYMLRVVAILGLDIKASDSKYFCPQKSGYYLQIYLIVLAI